MRLIDADALTAKLEEVGQYLSNPAFQLACIAAINEVKNAPTVDAEPVRHGKWEWEKYANGYETWECSVCRSPMITRFWYCPNCGAKMESENETD